MRTIAKYVLAVVVGLAAGAAPRIAPAADQLVYSGSWVTTNRPLDGAMTCVVTPIGKEKWQGRFYGVWQGVEFDYTVDFTGPHLDLRGTALIDGASYDWRAWMTRERFKANFSGSRYEGSFDLRRKSDDVAATE